MVTRIFISYHHKDDDNYRALINLLERENDIIIDNYSIGPDEVGRAKNPEYISSKLRERIKDSDTVVVLIGKKTHSRFWVNWEIEYANRQGKRIVGVWPQKGKDADLPEKMDDFGDGNVGWNRKKIIEAIRGEVIWENADGSPREKIERKKEDCS